MKTTTSKTYKKIPVYAPLSKRGFAFVLDWYLGSAFSTIPIGLLWNKLTGELSINTDLTLFESPYGFLAGTFGLLFGIFYFYIVPAFVWQGQTFGKKLLSIKIVHEDGMELSKGMLALRQIVGILFLEGAYMLTGNYIIQMVSMATVPMAGKILSYLMAALLIGSVALTVKYNRSIHDFLAHSIVIENNKN